MKKDIAARYLIPIVGAFTLWPAVTPAVALLLGLTIAWFFQNPYPTKDMTSKLLTWSVVGLGCGMNLETVATVGFQGLGYTFLSIAFVFFLGFWLRKIFKIEDEIGLLVTVGTAICGGSAIAAVAPVIKAKTHSISVALGTVFILNAVGLILFPALGHYFGMSEKAFGLWAALAIHDTSSVVGATVSYGVEAAAIGTTVKLARALWIVPVVIALSFWQRRSDQQKQDVDAKIQKTKKPWFILGFLMAAAIVTWVPALQGIGHHIEFVARRTLVLTLFLIGLGLSRENLKKVGFMPLLMGIVLWFLVLISMGIAVQAQWIQS